MNEIPLQSSVLAGFSYDSDPQRLWLRFRTGDLYVYRMVPASIARAFIEARSQGQYFNSMIRGRFQSDRLS